MADVDLAGTVLVARGLNSELRVHIDHAYEVSASCICPGATMPTLMLGIQVPGDDDMES